MEKFTKTEVDGGRLLAVMSCALITAPIILFTEKNKFAKFHGRSFLFLS